MRIVCWQMILMKYYTLFLSKIRTEVTIFVVCLSLDWRFKGQVTDSMCCLFCLIQSMIITNLNTTTNVFLFGKLVKTDSPIVSYIQRIIPVLKLPF